MSTNYQEGFVSMPDGQDLYYRVSGPKKSKGAILMAHGLGEHCGRYEDISAYLNEKSYQVYRYDHRGHGKTPGRRAYVDRFSDLYEDMGHMVDFVERDSGFKKPYLIAHSFGGQVAVNFLKNYPNKVRSVVLSAPNLKLAMEIGLAKKHLGRLFSYLLPTFSINNEVNPEHISRDPKVVESYKKDPLIEKNITLRLGAMILDNLEEVLSLAPWIKVPTFIFHGTDDKIVSVEGSKLFYEGLSIKEKKLKLYSGFYHECLHDLGKEEVYEDVLNWLKIN
ncbi:MAG: lysophospholipase [Deltaproteobacteria bacterium]|nr:lysophospholipase [Deltaproteobacteria bacterium]